MSETLEKLGAHDVAAWLRRHPTFLKQFPDLALSLVVPRDDPAALATALGTLIDDPALRARIAAAGRERALRHYAWEACVERMIAVQDAVTCRARSA